MVILLFTLAVAALLMLLVFHLVHPHVDALWGDLPSTADAGDAEGFESLSGFGA